MNFPAYVPAGAREHISQTLEGDGKNWKGINAFVIEYRGTSDAAMSLEQEQACLLRLAHDERMRDVYHELGKVFTADSQYGEFLRAAWNANITFAPYRQRVKQAKALAPKIAETARKLASLLDQAGKVAGGVAPPELYSIRTLLDATDNHELYGHNLHIWPIVRGAITGSAPENNSNTSVGGAVPPERVVVAIEENAEEVKRDNPDAKVIVIRHVSPGDAVQRDPRQETRNMLRYAWEKAPGLSALLGTVARAADDWKPQEYGAIGAAIASRKSSPSAEYVRAFAEVLRENIPDLEWSAPTYAAMAGVADVVLNDPNLAVTADAVRKALIRAADDSA